MAPSSFLSVAALLADFSSNTWKSEMDWWPTGEELPVLSLALLVENPLCAHLLSVRRTSSFSICPFMLLSLHHVLRVLLTIAAG